MNKPSNASPDTLSAKITFSLFTVTIFLLIGKTSGALKEIVFAAHLGTSPRADAYAYLFGTLTWPVSALSSALSVVLVPLLIRRRSVDGTDAAHFFRELVGAVLFWTALGASVAGVLLWYGLRFDFVGLAEPATREALALLFPLLMIVPLGSLGALLSARLMANQSHLNSLFEALPSLVLALAVMLVTQPSATYLAWATAGGFALWATALWLSQGLRQAPGMPVWGNRSQLWPSFLKSFAVVLVGQLVFTASGVVDQLMAAHLGPGANATSGYALRLIALATGLGSVAVARALLPILSQVAIEDSVAAAKLAQKWSINVFVVGIASAIVCWIFAPVGVKVLFERGAFTTEDTRAVAELVRYGVIQLPFYLSSLVLAQLVASTGRYNVFLKIGVIGIIAKCTASLVLVQYMGLGGMFLGTGVSSFIIALAMYFMSGVRSAAERPD